MLKRMQHALRLGATRLEGKAAEGIREGMALQLPPGVIVAEQGVCHVPEPGPLRTIVPVLHEAYVVLDLGGLRRCYATWLPHLGSWELLCLDDDSTGNAPGCPRAEAGQECRRSAYSIRS